MAKRQTRQRCMDLINGYCNDVRKAEAKLEELVGIYLKHGKGEGAYIDQIREGHKIGREAIERFRVEARL